MSSDEHAECIDVQKLNATMATITTSSSTVNTIQNSITEHVLNNELSSFVTNNKLSLDSNGHFPVLDHNKETNASINLKSSNNNSPPQHLNGSSNALNDKLNDLIKTNDDEILGLLSDQQQPQNSIPVNESRSKNFLIGDDDELFLITNPTTISLLKENLGLIRSDYFKRTDLTNVLNQNLRKEFSNDPIDLKKSNLNNIDLNNDQSNDKSNSAQQLKQIFDSIQESISTNLKSSANFDFLTNFSNEQDSTRTSLNSTTNTRSNSSTAKTQLLIEKNHLFNQFYNSRGDFNDAQPPPSQPQFNNNNNEKCPLDGCVKQFNHSSNPIPKLLTDDYLTEHDYSYLIHTDTGHQQSTIKQTSPMMNHHRNQLNNNNNSPSSITKQQSSPTRLLQQPDADDEGEEIFEDFDESTLYNNDEQQSTDATADQPQSNDKSNKSNFVDVESMKTQLAKLKLTKDFDSLNSLNNFNNSPLDELNDDNDNDFFDAIDEEIERTPLIRSTSLKTGKTKNLGPESKKMVRFADVLGLDLAKIKNISQEDLPNVPASAFHDLKMCKREVKEEFFNNQLSCSPVRTSQMAQWEKQGKFANNNTFNSSKTPILSNGLMSAGSDFSGAHWPVLVPEFVQPFTQFNFLERVRNQKVCLESCVVSSIGNNLSIDCIIRVQNISFEKLIMVRYTNNNWSTWLDSLASYIPNSCDGTTDKFSVKFYIKSLMGGQRVKFAIKYLADGKEYWDNNLGIDYCLLYKT